MPKIPSMRMDDFARAIAPEAAVAIVGIRPGEKLHEVMVPADDARHTVDYGDHYRILPEFAMWPVNFEGGQKLPEGFSYASDTNPERLTPEVLRRVAAAVAQECGIPYE